MKTVTTRELLTNHKSVATRLSAGESITWTSRGKVIAHLTPPELKQAEKAKRPDWVARARKTGAVNRGTKTISSLISKDRGE